MEIDYKLLGKRIKEIRERSRLTQEELADFADVTPQYISLVETGKKKASLQVLVDIAEGLTLTVDELLTGNQRNSHYEYLEDLEKALMQCSRYEKRIVYEQMVSLMNSLKRYREWK